MRKVVDTRSRDADERTPMTNLPNVRSARLPDSYSNARQALEQCQKVDECKSWADKAAALASYAKQADDDSLHKMATRIKARAIRRAGELLKELDARGDHRKSGDAPISSRSAAGERAGMSKDQQVQAVRVANVPDEAFEAQVESEEPPTVTKLAEQGTKRRTKPSDVGLPDDYLKGADPEEYKAANYFRGRLRELLSLAGDPASIARGSRSDLEGLSRDILSAQEYLAELQTEVCEEIKQWK